MIQTIRVFSKEKKLDTLGRSVKNQLDDARVKDVITARVYRIEGINASQAKVIAEKLFSEKFNQEYLLNSDRNSAFLSFEIAYKPGVMNPEVASILKAAASLGIKVEAADSSTAYYFSGGNKKKLLEIINSLKLFNSTVEYIVKSPPKTLKTKGSVGPTRKISIISATSKDLINLSKDKLYLNLSEMKVIQDYFKKIGRNPTDAELETIAQTWSEHCAHKTFKAQILLDGKIEKPLISRLKDESSKHMELVVSAYVDNSGVMQFYDGQAICGKVETHNSPSAIEPYGGAATGSGGVFRDILGTGLGAKTISATDIFCFARPTLPLSLLPEGCLAPDYVLKNVVRGVKDYGNRMGIPTNNGSVHFHDDFRAKPTIIVGGYGLIPEKIAKKRKPKTGDAVIIVGGKTGRDGIHGATFSSAEMTDNTQNVNSSAVQIGNAIEEKRMFDAIIEARDLGLIRAIQDCGAGGFSSAIGEMAEDTGVDVDLSDAPLKYQGLSPWEIWISESQERMALAIPQKNVKKFLEICKKYNSSAAVLGKFTNTEKIIVRYGKKVVCDLETDFLFNGLPQRKMEARPPKKSNYKEKKIKLKTKNDWVSTTKKVLASGNICSKEPIVRLYDHTVQGTNSMQPYVGEKLDGPTDAAIIIPILGKNYGMIVSHGLNPILNNIDPYHGSIWAAIEALSNYVAVGGDYRESSLINNYIWPFPDEEELWSLSKSVDAVVDIMKAFKIPVISGKDSLSSTYRGKDGKVIKIPPVLCISVFGRIADVKKTVSSDFKKEGNTICLVGDMDWESMGGSVFYQIFNNKGGKVPNVDIQKTSKVFKSIHKNIKNNVILSCHDVSEGGILTAVFEMCVGGEKGADINIPKKIKSENFLFNETPGAFLVEVKDKNTARNIFKDVPYLILGETSEGHTLNVKQGKVIFNQKVNELKQVWKKPMEKIFA